MYLFINVIFILICLLYAFCGEKYIKKSQRKYLYWILLFIFCFILAWRPVNTPDTQGYIYGFLNVDSESFFTGNILQKYGGYEIGYIFFMKVFKLFSHSYRLFFLLTALIGTYCIVNGLNDLYNMLGFEEDVDHRTQIFALYVACYGLLYNGITVRAGIAMGFGIIFVNLMLASKWFKAIAVLLLAILFQRTAVLYVFVYLAIKYLPVLSKKIHSIIWIIIGLLLFTGMRTTISQPLNAFMLTFFSEHNVSGINYLIEMEETFGMTVILMWLIYGFFIFISIDCEYYKRYLNVIMVGAFIVLLMHGISAISRAWDMFYMIMITMMCALYYHKSDLIRQYPLQRILLLVLLSVRSYKMLTLIFH